MKKMTEWFPSHIKPVHPGVYEIRYDLGLASAEPWYAKWNGKRWSWADDSIDSPWQKTFKGASQYKFWRGFTEKQE